VLSRKDWRTHFHTRPSSAVLAPKLVTTEGLGIWQLPSLQICSSPDSVHPYSNNNPARYRLRSATGTNYSVPRTRTKFGDRAFSVAGPVVWNSLPAAVRRASSLHFQTQTQIALFSLCFNDDRNFIDRMLLRHIIHCNAWRALNSLLPTYFTYLLTYYKKSNKETSFFHFLTFWQISWWGQ